MISYKELGLVNTKEMFAKAIDGGYAIPAFNFNNMEQLQAIIAAAAETKSPVILQVSKGARNYANGTLLRYMAEGAVAYAKELGWENPQIVLHLDHGDSFETCKSCIDSGFSSVMIDGSHLEYDENVALTKKVVEYAHQFDVTVEGELGVLAGVEDDVVAEHSSYTRPEEVEDFVTRTGVDSLAISIGTSHGAYKFTPAQCTRNEKGILVPPPLRFDILEEIGKCEDALEELCEYRPHILRTPQGALTPSLERCLLEDDYILVLWSLDTRDWDNKSTASITQAVLERVQAGDIILMHDYIGHNSKTPEALEKIIPTLLSRGYEFVNLSELLGLG